MMAVKREENQKNFKIASKVGGQYREIARLPLRAITYERAASLSFVLQPYKTYNTSWRQVQRLARVQAKGIRLYRRAQSIYMSHTF